MALPTLPHLRSTHQFILNPDSPDFVPSDPGGGYFGGGSGGGYFGGDGGFGLFMPPFGGYGGSGGSGGDGGGGIGSVVTGVATSAVSNLLGLPPINWGRLAAFLLGLLLIGGGLYLIKPVQNIVNETASRIGEGAAA